MLLNSIFKQANHQFPHLLQQRKDSPLLFTLVLFDNQFQNKIAIQSDAGE